MRHSGGGGSSHAPHTPVAAASVRSKPVSASGVLMVMLPAGSASRC